MKSLLLSGFIVFAQAYSDGPTSAWFKELSSPSTPNCCDQADCKQADAEWRGSPPTINEIGELIPGEGDWWARSNRTGQWARVEPDRVARDESGNIQHSIFPRAILCEGEPYIIPDSPPVARIYCLAPPPLGF